MVDYFGKLKNHFCLKYCKTNLVENDKIISRDEKIAKKFSEHLINIPNLSLTSNGCKCSNSSERDPILKIP